jgi:hypothetical protein
MADYDAVRMPLTPEMATISRGVSLTADPFINGGSAPVVHTYLMGGFAGGGYVTWSVTGTPDWTGASYPGFPPAPTGIHLIATLS